MGMTKEQRAEYMKAYRKKNLRYLKRYQHAWYLRNAERINYERRVRYYSDPEYRQYDLDRHREYRRKQRQRKEEKDGE